MVVGIVVVEAVVDGGMVAVVVGGIPVANFKTDKRVMFTRV